jgi:thioredoxin-dependent peroxiredoxin
VGIIYAVCTKKGKFMATITVHGTQTPLLGKEVNVGGEAPAARITKLDGTTNVIKTEVCSLGAKKFNDLIKQFKKLTTVMITTDDMEFVKAYSERESIDAAELVVDSDRNFAKKYGVLIDGGKLDKRLARAVYVINREGVVTYKEIVPEIVDEVNYDACIAAVDEAANEVKKGHTHEDWMRV